jgi:hypothetical protein
LGGVWAGEERKGGREGGRGGGGVVPANMTRESFQDVKKRRTVERMT